MRFLPPLLLFLASVFAAVPSATAEESGFLNRSVIVGGTEYRYQVYVPRERPSGVPLLVVLALHGGGSFGRDGLSQTNTGLAHAIRRNSDRFPAIVVFPQSPPGGTPGFQGLGASIALAALDKSLTEFPTDRARVYLTGLSMGGNGAYYIALHSPDRFAALLVVCGFLGEFTGTTSGTRYPSVLPASVADPHLDIAQRIRDLPVWIFHGDADPTVSVEESRRMAAALKQVSPKTQYTELPGVGHNAWDTAYGRADVLAWLFAQKRGQ